MSDFIITEQTKVHSLSLIGELFNIRHIRLKDSRKCKKKKSYLPKRPHPFFVFTYCIISSYIINMLQSI